ncbi:MAG: hypothetical protein JWQ59_1427 [Cryobacterium sp.]|nr:hypothetical protein [Cryobacterium sp.]
MKWRILIPGSLSQLRARAPTVRQDGAVTQSLGEAFAHAAAAKDYQRVRQLLHPELDFRAMTPNRIWEASDADGVISALSHWFEESDTIEAIDALDLDGFADRERVGYRFRVRNVDGEHLVEQQAYLTARDGQIGWLRIMCSGYRPFQ